MPAAIVLKASSGYNTNGASRKKMEVPVLGPTYWKGNRNNIRTDETKQNYDDVLRQSILENPYPDQDDLASQQIDTSWISKVLRDFRGYMYAQPRVSQSIQPIRAAPMPTPESDAIGRLNLRHLLRGA